MPLDSRIRFAVLGAALSLALAAPCAFGADADEAEAELLAVLKQETDIATKTRMNSDFVPGIVSILDGDRLRALGARTVWDAMAYVPGVQPVLDGTATPEVIVRGIPFPFNSGSIQILLNSVPIARESAGLNASVLLLPLVQVERVEFIRGPGSVLYGDFAFQGLVNIVTKRTGDAVEAGIDSHGGRDAALLASGTRGAASGSINLAAKTSDDAVLPLGTSAHESRFSGIANFKYGDFGLQSQAVDRHLTDAFAPPHTGAPPARGETNWSTDARYSTQWSESFAFDAHAQYLYNNVETVAQQFKGSEINSGVDLHWTGWAHQNWLAGLEYTDGSIDRAGAILQPPPGSTVPPATLVITNRHRDVASLFLQDQIELTPAWSATLGARYDDNSEIGSRVTPRAALVWQPAEHHVLKFQYSEGYRAPAFFELYGGGTRGNLDFEVNRTAELNYVYERPQLTARATLFHTRIADMVFIDPAARAFGNVAWAKAAGAEFEASAQLGASLRLDANLSYVDSRDNRDLPRLLPQPIAEVPHWMGNLGLLWNPARDWTAGVHWNHIGDRLGAAPAGGSYDLVDLSLTRRALFWRELDGEISVDNALDKRIVELQPGPFGDIQNPYRARIAWARVTWHLP